MKSSDNQIENAFINESGFLSNGPLYSLLAIYMPVTILAAFILLLETTLGVNLHSFLLIICGFAGGLAASFYCDFMINSKSSHTAADIRGGIIIVFICYGCTSLLRRELILKERFFPDITNIASCAASLYTWIYVISLKRLFSARRHFETYTNLYQGEKLQSVLFGDSALLQYTEENIDKTQWRYFLQLVLITFTAFVCSILRGRLPLSLYALLACLLTGAICLFGFFEIMKWEHYYAGEGISVSINDRTKRILAMIILTVICLSIAIFPASNKSILSFSLITDFFKWLFSLFRRPLQLTEENISQEIPMSETLPGPSPFDFEIRKHSPLWEIVTRYLKIILKYAIIVLAAAAFIRFIISPLLNRGGYSKEMSFHRRLIRITTEWFRGIINFFASFFANLKNSGAIRKLRKFDEAEIRRTAESLFSAYSSAKKSEIKQSVTLFAKLILWGSEVRHVEWKPSLAPAEYCAVLSAASQNSGDAAIDSGSALHQINEGIIRCGEIFEKALYSAEILGDAEKDEYKNLVEKITAV